MVQNYIKRMNNRGALITCSVANAAPKALIRKCLSVIDVIDVDFSSWAQGLFCWMGFSRRQKFSVKVDIPATARKEIEYLFLYEIVLRVEQYAIADLLTINFDQTPLKLVQCANSTLVKKKQKKHARSPLPLLENSSQYNWAMEVKPHKDYHAISFLRYFH